MILRFDRALYPPAYLQQKITEKQVQAEVMAELQRLGITAWVNDAGAAMLRGRAAGALAKAGRRDLTPMVMRGRAGAGGKGLPDICGYLSDGRALFIECKAPEWREQMQGTTLLAGQRQIRPAGKLKPEQREFLERARAAGCAAGVVWHVKDLLLILPEPYRSKI